MNTLIFSEPIDSFITAASYSPIHNIKVGGVEYFIDGTNSVYKTNCGYGNSDDMCMIRFISNEDYPVTKVFDNAELYFNNEEYSNITSSYFETKKQTSNTATSSDFDIREHTHKLAIPRVTGSDRFAERMRDKYIICNYFIDRTTENNYYFSIPYIKTRYRYSSI